METETLTMQEVQSSTISHIGYEPTSQELRIRFKHGGEYLYKNVTEAEHAALMAAESIGKHFMANIRPKHTGAKQQVSPKQKSS